MTENEAVDTGVPVGPASSTAAMRYLVRINDMQLAATELRELLDQLIVNCSAVSVHLDEGEPVLQVVRAVGDERGRAFRRELHAAARRFDRTMQATRGESFRILVVEGQRSVTDVARTAGLSVQMGKRLVDSVVADDPSASSS